MNAEILSTAKALPLSDRVELLDALWESIVAEGHEPPLTVAQSAELDRRLEAHRRNPNDLVPWNQVKTEAEARYHGSR